MDTLLVVCVQEKLAFLHGMYQRLLAGRVMVPPKDTSIHKFTWADLTSLVYEQMCNLVTSSQRTDEKVSKGKIILCFKIPL